MGVEAGSTQGPNPGRVPASTIRAVRIFHRQSVEGMAQLFGLTVRTIHRWEERGVLPSTLLLDHAAKCPDWRPKLLLWMVARYERAGVSDSRTVAP